MTNQLRLSFSISAWPEVATCSHDDRNVGEDGTHHCRYCGAHVCESCAHVFGHDERHLRACYACHRDHDL